MKTIEMESSQKQKNSFQSNKDKSDPNEAGMKSILNSKLENNSLIKNNDEKAKIKDKQRGSASSSSESTAGSTGSVGTMLIPRLQSIMGQDPSSIGLNSTNSISTINPSIEKSDKTSFLFACDPETLHTIRIELPTGNFYLDLFSESQEVKTNAKKHLDIINQILQPNEFKWLFDKSQEAQRYRRRKFPSYLLLGEASEFPCYVYQSELSKAFSKQVEVDVDINLIEFQNELKGKKVVLSYKESLVTSMNETLKNLLRMVKKDYGVELKPKKNYFFALKVDGYRDYLRGNYSLLAYERVRIVLRKREHLKLILTQLPNKTTLSLFPPVYDMSETESFDYDALKNISPLFWYPQEPIQTEFLSKRVNTSTIKHTDKFISFKKSRKNRMINICESRVSEKLSPIQMQDYSKKLISGECNWAFSIKLFSLERLHLIFKELNPSSRIATFNGNTEPTNLNLPSIVKNPMKLCTKSPFGSKLSASQRNVKRVAKRNETQPISHVSSSYNNSFWWFSDLVENKKFPFVPLSFYLEMRIYNGSEPVSEEIRSSVVPLSSTLTWNETISFPKIRYCILPKNSRICFNICCNSIDSSIVIGTVSHDIFDENGKFQSGLKSLSIWPFYKYDPRLGCMKEYHGIDIKYEGLSSYDPIFTILNVEFHTFVHQMYWGIRDYQSLVTREFSSNSDDREDDQLLTEDPTNQDLAELKRLLIRDSLEDYNLEEKKILFKSRKHYCSLAESQHIITNKSLALPIFLKSVNWTRPVQVKEVYRMLEVSEPMDPEEAICLLDAKFSDDAVRLYAVERISQMSDDNLAIYMLQFSQALLYETHHFCPLAEMLLERSLKNHYIVGNAFFWSLKSNLHQKTCFERYNLYLEQFLMLCGRFKIEILLQDKVNENLAVASKQIVDLNSNKPKDKKGKDSNAGKDLFKLTCRKILYKARTYMPNLFTFTIEPKLVIRDFDYQKLIVFNSKKVPLCVVGLNNQIGGENVRVIFKNGDDLRQDILTLQIILLIDKIWLESNLDFKMTPYRVIGTGDQQGYLEFVANSRTLADFQRDYKLFGAFKDDVVTLYFQNLYKNQPDKLEQARETFLLSVAGYCVATYVLGIGDRHPDNIMVSQEGNFLHIDFGHFLGHFKTKFGFNRERDPFVLSPDVLHFITGESCITFQDDISYFGTKAKERFLKFEDKCCLAFNTLRKHGNKLINIFLIMLSAGIAELSSPHEVSFLRSRLFLHLTDEEASAIFKREIFNSVTTFYRRIDNFIHNVKVK